MWAADYLRWLWYHEGDAALPKLALFALKPLLEYDAEVDMSGVCICNHNTVADSAFFFDAIIHIAGPERAALPTPRNQQPGGQPKHDQSEQGVLRGQGTHHI